MLDLNKELLGVMSAMNEMGKEFDKRLPDKLEKITDDDLRHMMLCSQLKMIAISLLHISASIKQSVDMTILDAHGFRKN